ncbi:PepSY domain-containing protein [Enterococcus xiangfangensis]|uniref:PepSY domain-containing protein n=1 Tax=Enterococcus xiangfangensis TaxID=1296537 RepID=A0ABU3F6B2_9ENTE|nr:PepSY domain-containing protein [Enterococcus xiangfangensis]MDT2758203.1 PepSY domain-containing protein [Enterococcus xiangfangensis]
MKKIIVLGLSAALLAVLASCGSNPEYSSSSSSSSAQETSQTKASDTTDTDFKVSVDDAIEAYQEAYPDSEITSIDLETSLGKYLYKIEGVDDDKEYELRVDANTKAVSKEREENLDTEDQAGVKRTEDKLDLQDLLSIKQVSDIAEEHVGDGKATDWSLDKEDGTTYWEVKVTNGNEETEVKIDAKTGEVLETDVDD